MKRSVFLAIAVLIAPGAFAQQAPPAPSAPSRSQSVRIVPRPDNDLSVRIWTQQREYSVGENIQINYRASTDAYVLIFSTDARGETRQLLPNAYDNDNFVRGGQTYSIPNRGYRLEVTPPMGRETLSIVAFRERYRTLQTYEARGGEAFPKSEGPRAAVARVIVRPDNDDRDDRYAEDSTTIQVRNRWNNDDWYGDRWDNDRNDGPDRTRRGYGRLSIDSDPAGAYVYIGGQYRGITPLDLGQIQAGNYDIIINRAGFQPARRRVNLESGERERVNEDLRPIRYR